MNSEEMVKRLMEASKKVESLQPSAKPPPLLYVYLGILAVAMIYMIATHKPSRNPGPRTKAEMNRLVREMAQEDARKELERAAEVYGRTLVQPSPSP